MKVCFFYCTYSLGTEVFCKPEQCALRSQYLANFRDLQEKLWNLREAYEESLKDRERLVQSNMLLLAEREWLIAHSERTRVDENGSSGNLVRVEELLRYQTSDSCRFEGNRSTRSRVMGDQKNRTWERASLLRSSQVPGTSALTLGRSARRHTIGDECGHQNGTRASGLLVTNYTTGTVPMSVARVDNSFSRDNRRTTVENKPSVRWSMHERTPCSGGASMIPIGPKQRFGRQPDTTATTSHPPTTSDPLLEVKVDSEGEVLNLVRVLNEHIAQLARWVVAQTKTSEPRPSSGTGRNPKQTYVYCRLQDILGCNLFHVLKQRHENDRDAKDLGCVELAIQATLFYLITRLAEAWPRAPTPTLEGVGGTRRCRYCKSLYLMSRPSTKTDHHCIALPCSPSELRQAVHSSLTSDALTLVNEILEVSNLVHREGFEVLIHNSIGNLWRTADSISENMKDPALSDLYHLLLYYGSYRTKIEGTILAPHDL